MRLVLLALLLVACSTEMPEGDSSGWPNAPEPGVYEVSVAEEELDECGFVDVFTEQVLWNVALRNSARDAFQLVQPQLALTVMCGYANPGYMCFESDIGTWLTGGRDIAVWMDGVDAGDGFDIAVDALETCASAGGGCAEPCESRFTLHFAGPG